MLINKTFADFFMTDGKEEIQFYNQKFLSWEKCITQWQIKWINLEYITWNVWPVFDVNINLENNWIQKTIKSYWVMNFWDSHFEWEIPGLFVKVNEKKYVPEIGDQIVAKINPENNYISELYLMNWKSINEINDFAKTLNLPYCSWNTITQEPEKLLQNYSNYSLFWSLVLALIIFWVLVFKLLKNKK